MKTIKLKNMKKLKNKIMKSTKFLKN